MRSRCIGSSSSPSESEAGHDPWPSGESRGHRVPSGGRSVHGQSAGVDHRSPPRRGDRSREFGSAVDRTGIRHPPSAIRIGIDEPYIASKQSLLHVTATANDVRCVFHRGVDVATPVGPAGRPAMPRSSEQRSMRCLFWRPTIGRLPSCSIVSSVGPRRAVLHLVVHFVHADRSTATSGHRDPRSRRDPRSGRSTMGKPSTQQADPADPR